MATKKFYENYEHVVTPTSKNVVLEYKGDYSVYFGITVDISGKNATKYSSYYENVSVKNGDDLIVKTIFISNSGSAKTVTTTVKDYFTNPYFDNNLVLESNLLKNQTYTINQNTEFGTNGLYMEKGDFNSSDFILAPKYDYEESFKLNNIYDDFVYDEKGKDNYVISSSSAYGRDYFLEMAGNDKYSASNASNPDIKDLKGNDEYVAEEPDTRMEIEDYSGNDKYIAQDFATIITHDYKGNDEYWLYSHMASYIQDNSGNDKYTFVNAWVTTGANIIENRYGNDKYDIEKSIAVLIGDYSGKDEYKIKNIDTSSKNYESANFIIVDYSGNDKYELENISSREEQTRSHISDELGNDSYLATNVNHVSFYDKKGNDKYNFISGKNATIYDWLGKDTYTLKGTETEKLMQLTINDMDTSKKTASDKYILEKTDYVTITDNAGNDKYTVNDSNYFEFLEHSGKDTYNLIGTEENKVSNFYITDYAGNDKYTLEHINKVYYGEQEPDISSIVEKQGNDSYSIKDTKNLIITDELGNDKYTLKEKHSNLFINDKSGKDTYKSEKGVDLSCTYIYDSGTDNDTYSLSGFDTGLIEDEGGNNKFDISDSYELTIDAIGQGNDKYNLKNIETGTIEDVIGNDKYTILTCTDANITDGQGADSYTVKGSYNKKTKETTYVKNIVIEDRSIENDTYYFDKVYGVPEVNTISDEGGNDKYSIKDTTYVSIKDNNGNDKYTLQNRINNGYIKDYDGEDTYTSKGKTTLWSYSITDYGTAADTYTLNGGNNLSITDEGGNNKFSMSNCYESGITATGNGNDTYKYTNMSDCWIDDSAGNDNYNINKSWLSNIEDYAGSDVYKFTNTEIGYITDSEGDDNYSIVKSTDINIEDYDGNDTYTVDIKGIRNGHYYIDDCGSDTDSLTILGLSAKNVVYLSDIDKNGKTTGDLIILDKANKSYIQINHFYNYDEESGYILNEFDEGCIETIKAGKTTLNITSDIRDDINNIKGQIAGWLTTNDFVNVNEALSSGTTDQIAELTAYFTNASN